MTIIKLDRFTKILLTFLVVGVWGLLLSPLIHPQPAVAQDKEQWEFAWVVTENVSKMEKLREDGWQIVAARTQTNGDGVIYFQRRQQSSQSQQSPDIYRLPK
ncbi:hypothetical protein RIVM261_078270 [Rivularia sp. IAM M-261]|nr:hypothetical protein RIVM261_078270 [Rivularia sp. IAM M-261]